MAALVRLAQLVGEVVMAPVVMVLGESIHEPLKT